MVNIGQLLPSKNSSGGSLMRGESEGEQALAFWLNIYLPNRERTRHVIGLLSSGDEEWRKILCLEPLTPNFHCETMVLGECLFILTDDPDGKIDKVIALKKEHVLNLLIEYLECIETGKKNSSPFLFEYIAEMDDALQIYREQRFQNTGDTVVD